MTGKKQSENFVFPLHHGRLFQVNDEWYFATRESMGHGPFADYESAETACRAYVQARQRNNQASRVS